MSMQNRLMVTLLIGACLALAGCESDEQPTTDGAQTTGALDTSRKKYQDDYLEREGNVATEIEPERTYTGLHSYNHDWYYAHLTAGKDWRANCGGSDPMPFYVFDRDGVLVTSSDGHRAYESAEWTSEYNGHYFFYVPYYPDVPSPNTYTFQFFEIGWWE